MPRSTWAQRIRVDCRHHAACLGARVGRAGIDRPRRQAAQLFRQVERMRGRRPGVARFAPAARLDQKPWRRMPTTRSALVAAAASAGREIEKLARRLPRRRRTAARTARRGRRSPRPRPRPATRRSPRSAPATTCRRARRPSRSQGRAPRRSPTRMPVKLPGPTPTRMRFGLAPVEQLIEHRHQPLRMAAADELVAARDAFAGPVEQSGGAGGTRRVERQDHGRDSGHRRARRRKPLEIQTASTDSTSGT